VPFSEVEAFCIDLQARNTKRLTFIVRHWRDTKKGGYKLTDERDVYELCANQAQRRLRACILASIPGDVTDAAMQQAEVTLKSKADTSPEGIAKMLDAFAPFGVTREHVEKRIQRRLDSIQPAQVVSLKRIYASLRDDMSSPKDWFEIDENTQKAPPPPKHLPTPSDAEFEQKLPGWAKTVESGKKTAPELLAMLSTKAVFSEEQKARILSLKTKAEDAQPVEAAVQQAAAPGLHVADTDGWLADYEGASEGQK